MIPVVKVDDYKINKKNKIKGFSIMTSVSGKFYAKAVIIWRNSKNSKIILIIKIAYPEVSLHPGSSRVFSFIFIWKNSLMKAESINSANNQVKSFE